MKKSSTDITIPRIKAFTILEVVIVVAIMGILISIFFGALNRYGEQLKQEVEVKNELNHLFLIRSNIWKEYDRADSVVTINNSCTFYSKDKRINYTIKNGDLLRIENGNEKNLNLEMNKIEQIQSGQNIFCTFNFQWKDREMILSLPKRQNNLNRINAYFMNEKWK